MRFIRKKSVVLILLLLVAWPAAVTAFPVIASKHKHPPSEKGRAQSAVRSGKQGMGVVVASRAKQKPATRRSRISSAVLNNKISSKTAIVMDAQTGKTIYSLRPNSPRQPASTIKVLTGLIAINSLKDSELVPTSRRAANMPRSKIYLKKGKSYYANDLINAVLLASANDASVALAEKIAGSERAFAKLMTSKAAELGAKKTVCKSASGLTTRGQYSTARDLAVIFNNAMQDEDFAKRMSLTKVKTRHGITLRTHNKALWQVVGAEGGKTGYTRAARQTYVGKFRRGQDELVVAIMGSETMWKDVNYLVEYGFDRLKKSGVKTAKSGHSKNGARVVSAKKTSPEPLAALQVLSDKKKFSKL